MTEPTCWLCRRPLGQRVQKHHFTNAELARLVEGGCRPDEDEAIARFLAWIADKPPDFTAPTRTKR